MTIDSSPLTYPVPAGMEHMSRVPLAVAIGMQVTNGDGARAHGVLPYGDAIAIAPGGAIDPLALLPFVDQLSSFPLAMGRMATGGGDTGMSTIDLALAFTADPGRGPLAAVAHAATATGAARLVTSEVTDADGRIVATGSAWFAIGKPPGGGTMADRDRELLTDHAIDRRGPFQAMIGLAPDDDDGALLAADVWPAVGWVGLPALHGGAVAAALARAGQQRVATLGRDDLRLASIAVRYLRAAGASGAVARAQVDAIGRRTARLSATIAVADAVVASAQLLFVVD